MSIEIVRAELRAHGSPEAAALCRRYFKTGPGDYGEGDVFLGLRAADLRRVAKTHRDLGLPEVERLLQSPVHEDRAAALLILVHQMAKAAEAQQKRIATLYLGNTRHINNWDLVDCSARDVLGVYLENRDRKVLYKLAKSRSLWERRIAIVSTHHFIRHLDFGDTLSLAELLLRDGEDLIHKAAGWMLREMGQRDRAPLEMFLNQHGPAMPRTMLRYAIEHFPPGRRKQYLEDTKKR